MHRPRSTTKPRVPNDRGLPVHDEGREAKLHLCPFPHPNSAHRIKPVGSYLFPYWLLVVPKYLSQPTRRQDDPPVTFHDVSLSLRTPTTIPQVGLKTIVFPYSIPGRPNVPESLPHRRYLAPQPLRDEGHNERGRINPLPYSGSFGGSHASRARAIS